MSRQPFGFVNAFKPPGPSSTAFGAWARRLYANAPVGHWGTLDPRACGVLVLAIGTAARLLPLIVPTTKRYAFELVVGERTDTGDASGVVIERKTPPPDFAEKLDEAVGAMHGVIEQIPPMHSAVKMHGRPLYESARAGRQVARAPRRTTIYELGVLGWVHQAARLVVECDAGTYVRTLCEQLGMRMGVPARMGALVRLQAGPFRLRDARLPREMAADPNACIVDPAAVLPLPRIVLTAESADRFAHGNHVPLSRDRGADIRAENEYELGAESLVLLDQRVVGTAKIMRAGETEWLAPTRVLI